jgi:hypothetical protein
MPASSRYHFDHDDTKARLVYRVEKATKSSKVSILLSIAFRTESSICILIHFDRILDQSFCDFKDRRVPQPVKREASTSTSTLETLNKSVICMRLPRNPLELQERKFRIHVTQGDAVRTFAATRSSSAPRMASPSALGLTAAFCHDSACMAREACLG